MIAQLRKNLQKEIKEAEDATGDYRRSAQVGSLFAHYLLTIGSGQEAEEAKQRASKEAEDVGLTTHSHD